MAQYQATYGAEETKEETTEAAESDDKQQQFMQVHAVMLFLCHHQRVL